MPIAKTPCRMRLFWCFVLCVALFAAPLAAQAQSDAAVDKVTKMNKKAVEEYEDRNGIPEEPVTLSVLEMYVTVHNPIHDFRVVLGPGG